MAVAAMDVSSEQAAAFRLSRHHLLRRASRNDLVATCGDVIGVQAQVLSAAALSLRARVRTLRAEDVDHALWKDRSLVKSWAMRGTLHLMPADQFRSTLSALRGKAMRNLARWSMLVGVTEREITAILDSIHEALVAGPMTRHALADHVVRHAGEKARRWVDHQWGGLVQAAAIRGRVCFGPSRLTETTFVRCDRWVPSSKEPPSDDSGTMFLRRYLKAYGPAAATDVAYYSGLMVKEVRAQANDLAPELAQVSRGGRPGWILREDVKALERAKQPSTTVNLLPHFDTFLLAHRDKSDLIPPKHIAEVFRPAGWISPVLLVNGRVRGVWRLERRAADVTVRLHPFGAISREVREGADAEVEDIGRFLGVSATLTRS